MDPKEKERQTEEEVGKHEGVDTTGVWRLCKRCGKQSHAEMYCLNTCLVPRRQSRLRD